MAADPSKAQQTKQKEKKQVKVYQPGNNCPKCGPGVKLATHKDRLSCGKCGYFVKK